MSSPNIMLMTPSCKEYCYNSNALKLLINLTFKIPIAACQTTFPLPVDQIYLAKKLICINSLCFNCAQIDCIRK